MAESLYTTQTPDVGSTDLADLTGGGSTATTVKFAVAGQVTGGRFFAPATIGGATFKFELWELSTDTTGTLLGTATYGAVTGGAWNTVNLGSPVTVTASKVYRVATHNSAGRYVARAGVFTSPLVNGSITGIQAGTSHTGATGLLYNGTFQVGAAGVLPGSHFGSPSYLADLLFDPTGITGSVAATVGVPAAASAGVLSIPGVAAAIVSAPSSVMSGLVNNPGEGEGLSISAIMAEVASRLDTIPGLRVYGWPPGSVTPPAAIVGYPEEIVFDAAFRRGMDTMSLPVLCVIGRPTDRNTPTLIGQYAKGAGLRSVKSTLETGAYATVHTLRVARCTFDAVSIGGTEYMAALFDIEITGSGD